jgi:hypothetical protein
MCEMRGPESVGKFWYLGTKLTMFRRKETKCCADPMEVTNDFTEILNERN